MIEPEEHPNLAPMSRRKGRAATASKTLVLVSAKAKPHLRSAKILRFTARNAEDPSRGTKLLSAEPRVTEAIQVPERISPATRVKPALEHPTLGHLGERNVPDRACHRSAAHEQLAP